MDDETRDRAAEIFDALGNPIRLKIVALLNDGRLSVNEIAAGLQIGQSSASQHLSVLSRAGILAVEPRGAARLYGLRGPRIPRVLQLVEEFCHVHGLREEVGRYGTGE